MSADPSIPLTIVGSVALDTIETPLEKHADVLGGSCSYACAAASFFVQSGMVGVVGEDFPAEHQALYRQLGIDTAGLLQQPGQTFRWSGVYEANMNQRRTLSTALNVFESFSPELPAAYRAAPFMLLGNIAPALQLQVLEQATAAPYVVADTMDLWIRETRADLCKVLERCTMLMLNDDEARLLTGESNLRRSAQQILDMGPSSVVIKRGEFGGALVTQEGIFLAPAYPVPNVVDPTGAGDSFAGAFLGALAEAQSLDDAAVRNALMYGSVVASFGVGGFGLEAFRDLTRKKIDVRLQELRSMIRC